MVGGIGTGVGPEGGAERGKAVTKNWDSVGRVHGLHVNIGGIMHNVALISSCRFS